MGDAFIRVLDAFHAHDLRVDERGDQANCQSPGHSAADRSVSVTRGRGLVLVTPHAAGETREEVLEAVGLTDADLFDNRKDVRYDYPDNRVVYRRPGKKFSQDGNTKGTALYLSDKLPLDLATTVYVTEGEKDADQVVRAGGAAVSSAGGAGKAHRADWGPLRGRPVVAIADKDSAGHKHAVDVANILKRIAAKVTVVEARSGKDAADHLEAGHGLDEFNTIKIPAGDTVQGDDTEHGPRVWLATDLRPAAAQRWLVRRRIPAAAVSLLVGDEGIGKSLFWVWIVAAITTGTALPEIGLPARAPGNVVLVLTEDDWASTVLPRLIVAGADITKIIVICEEDDGSGSPLFPNHMGIVEEAAQDHLPALVVVDAWLDTVPSGINVKDPHGARLALHPWKNFATHYETAVLLLTHTNRVATGNARDKYGITSELRKKVRMSLFAQIDEESGELLIGPEKSNLVGDVPASKFTIQAVQHFEPSEDTDGTVPELLYAGEHENTSREIIATKFEDESGGPAEDWTAAEKWLHDILVVAGKLPSKDIKIQAATAKISERTVKRAAQKLNIAYTDEGFPRVTSWELPEGHGDHCDVHVCVEKRKSVRIGSEDSQASQDKPDPVSPNSGPTGPTVDDLHKHNGLTTQSGQWGQSGQPQTHRDDGGPTDQNSAYEPELPLLP